MSVLALGEVLVLDPVEISSGRVQFDLTPFVGSAGPDWGDAAIEQYLADAGKQGQLAIDYKIPDRVITVPLALTPGSGLTYDQLRTTLQQKVGRWMDEGGWVKRQTTLGNVYAEVVSASLKLSGSTAATLQQADDTAMLTITCQPEWFGDEITLVPLSGIGCIASALLDGTITNYVPTPSFEYTTTGAAPLNWTTTDGGYYLIAGAGLTAQTSAGAQSGVKSMRVVTTAASHQGAAYSLGVLPAGTYTASAYMKGNVGGEAVEICAGPQSAGAVVTSVTATTSWVRQSATFVSDGVAPSFIVVRNASAVALTFFVDAIQVTKTPAAVAYTDGDTLGSFWTGTPGSSTTAATAVIKGDMPGRVRIVVNETSTNDQHGLWWAFRSRHADPSATSRPFYEAEALSPMGGAAIAAHAGASGGSVIKHTTLAAGVWTSILSTDILAGTVGLTQIGSYRVLARCNSATATPQFQLQWGVGDVLFPETNNAVALPSANNFHILDLGGVRLDAPPIGPYKWKGVIQAKVAVTNDPVEIDALYIVPVQANAGRLSTVSPDAVVFSSRSAEVRTDGMYRQDPSGTVYAIMAAAAIGDLPRIPVSGAEGRPVEIFVKASRGDFTTVPDSALDSLTVQVIYRPSYLFCPE